jgi:prophage regulatory protein
MADQYLYFLNSLLRRHTVEKMTGDSRTTIYRNVKRKLLTPPVKIGGGRVAWPQSEIVAINKARIAGKNDEQIMALVIELCALRLGGCDENIE